MKNFGVFGTWFAIASLAAALGACFDLGAAARNKGGSAHAPSPSECLASSEQPARIFHAAPATPASKGAPPQLEIWVLLHANNVDRDELLPETFESTVDAEARIIRVSGKVRRWALNPEANCHFAPEALRGRVETVRVPLSGPPGTYTLVIPPEQFTAGLSPYIEAPGEYPTPTATRSVTIDP